MLGIAKVSHDLQKRPRGARVAQLVKHLPSARVMIPRSWDRVPQAGGVGEGEAGSPPSRKPDVGLDPRTLGS